MARILVVDDEISIRISFREFLKDAGHQVGLAEDADRALRLLSVKDFDVVVTDIILPRVSGVKLLGLIKQTSPHVAIVLMTGEPTTANASDVVRAGAVGYLHKPICKELLLNTVANAAMVKYLDDGRRDLIRQTRAAPPACWVPDSASPRAVSC